MPAARPHPKMGAVFVDARGDERGLRVSWHGEADVVVLSLWRENVCTATFRLPVEDVPAFIATLTKGLAHGYFSARGA